MKKEKLKEIGLTDEQILAVMKENGLDIENEKSKAKEQADALQGQLDTVNEALKKFDGVNVEELNGQITKLKTDLETQKTKYETQIADRDFSESIKAAITTAGGKNAKAIMALLDTDALKASKNQETDIKAAIEACQKDNDYLFGSNEPINNPVGPTGGDPTPTPNTLMNSMKSIMGITD